VSDIILLNTLYKPNFGGVENSIDSLSYIYLSMGYRVTIICSDIGIKKECDPCIDDNLPAGLTIIRYKSKLFGVLKGPAIRVFFCYHKLKFFKNKGSLNLVLSRHCETTVAAGLARVKNLVYLPGAIAHEQFAVNSNVKSIRSIARGYLAKIIQKLALRLAKYKVLVFSKNMEEGIKRELGVEILRTVKPGVDRDRFFKISENQKEIERKRLGIGSRKRVFLILGRIVPQKNVLLAVKMANLFGPNDHLLVVGEGSDSLKVEKFIECEGLFDKVTFLPATSEPERFYKVSDWFLMLSSYEPFGQTLLEATACGLNISALSSLAGVETATEEIYKEYPALVCFSNDKNENRLWDAINKTEQNADIFETERMRFLESYSWRALANELLDLQHL